MFYHNTNFEGGSVFQGKVIFRVESISLKTHWVMTIMDQYTRRIIGFSAEAGNLDSQCFCRMLNKIISTIALPNVSSDNDPLFEYSRWKANLRILEIDEIKTIPKVPISHPFIERLIGTVRREHLDQMLFWGSYDLEKKLGEFQEYYNSHRMHSSLNTIPDGMGREDTAKIVDINKYRWKKHCRGFFQTPIAA